MKVNQPIRIIRVGDIIQSYSTFKVIDVMSYTGTLVLKNMNNEMSSMSHTAPCVIYNTYRYDYKTKQWIYK